MIPHTAVLRSPQTFKIELLARLDKLAVLQVAFILKLSPWMNIFFFSLFFFLNMNTRRQAWSSYLYLPCGTFVTLVGGHTCAKAPTGGNNMVCSLHGKKHKNGDTQPRVKLIHIVCLHDVFFFFFYLFNPCKRTKCKVASNTWLYGGSYRQPYIPSQLIYNMTPSLAAFFLRLH